MSKVRDDGFNSNLARCWIPYNLWEDAKNGLYENFKGNKEKAIQRIVNIFSSFEETERLMFKVIEVYINSCKFNLSNTSLNRVAWLGQACCNIDDGFSEDIVRLAWAYVPEDKKIQANNIAKRVINYWESKNG